jgi:hypothetical protein
MAPAPVFSEIAFTGFAPRVDSSPYFDFNHHRGLRKTSWQQTIKLKPMTGVAKRPTIMRIDYGLILLFE